MSALGSVALESDVESAAPVVDQVASDNALPAAADVVVVGGGIVGVSTALFLARRGLSVVLCEKGSLAGEQSSRNWGWVRTMGRDPRELPLMIESMRIWDEVNRSSNAALGFRRSGIAYLCRDQDELARRNAWLDHVRSFGLDIRLIGPEAVGSLLPGSQHWAGALYAPGDGRAEPQKATPAFAREARRLGAGIVTGCAVRGIETAAGRVAFAITEHGAIKCRAVVLAGGAWSRLFCRNLGVTLPLLKVLASVMRVDGVADGPDTAALGPGFAFRKRLDGGYTVANSTAAIADIVPDSFCFLRAFLPVLKIERKTLTLRIGRRFLEEACLPRRWRLDQVSPFERVRILDPVPASGQLDSAVRCLAAAFPAFQAARRRQHWAGLIDATPDALPVISAVESLPGFYVATGFSGHGFGLGPAAGRLMAELVTGDDSVVDPGPFRFSRFTDGSHPRPTTGL